MVATSPCDGARSESRAVLSAGTRRVLVSGLASTLASRAKTSVNSDVATSVANVIAWAPEKPTKTKRGDRHAGLPFWSPFGPAGSTACRRTFYDHTVLLGRGLIHRTYRDRDAAFSFGTKLELAVDQGKERMIFTHADVTTGMPFGAALARNDVPGQHLFAAENLQPEALSSRIAAVTRRSACFLVCHYRPPKL